jgi:HAMP domain-containing protein
MRRSIRTRLTIAFILVSLIPLLLVGVVLALQSFNVQSQQALRFQKEVTLRVSTQVESFVNRLELQLRTAAKSLRELDEQGQQDFLANLPSYPRVFQELSVIGSDGVERFRLSRLDIVTPADLRDVSQTPEFSIPKTMNQLYYGPVQFDPDTGEPSMTISVPLFNPDIGAVDGVLSSNIRFKEIWDLIAQVQVQSGESVYIVSAQNKVIAHLNPSVVLRNTTFNIPADGIYSEGGLDTPAVVIASNKLQFGNQQFNIVAERNVYVALALAIQTVIVTVVLLVVALLLASVEGFYIARQLTRPIQSLASVAETLSVQAEAYKPEMLTDVVQRTDELGQLARVFQKMGSEVRSRELTLKRQVKELEIKIDETRRQREVAQIVESDLFRELQAKAEEMRTRHRLHRAAPPKSEEPPSGGTTGGTPSDASGGTPGGKPTE